MWSAIFVPLKVIAKEQKNIELLRGLGTII
jgi:hypothetical protein